MSRGQIWVDERGVDDGTAELDSQLTAELDRRLAALDRGEAVAIPLEEVRARVLGRLATLTKK